MAPGERLARSPEKAMVATARPVAKRLSADGRHSAMAVARDAMRSGPSTAVERDVLHHRRRHVLHHHHRRRVRRRHHLDRTGSG
jgi:hypothetical protein